MRTLRRILPALIIAALGLAFTSCSNDDDPIIWDFSPVCIRLNIVDAEGNDLLAADTPGNILDSGLTATFDGKEYPLVSIYDEAPGAEAQTAKSRYLPARFHGLFIQDPEYYNPSDSDKHKLLCFGEFNGFDNFDHTVVFHFPSVGRDISFRVVSKARWKGDDPDWNLEYYLDGKQIHPEQGMWISGIEVVLTD